MGDIFMWIILGLVAIVFMVLNIVIRNQHGWLGYISLAFTALTVCAFYQNAANFVAQEDFSALMDIVPTMSKILWVCTFISIVINSIFLFKRK